MVKLASEFEVVCPCCGTTQTVDANLRRVVAHQAPEDENKPELDEAQRILAEEAARREALFQQSVLQPVLVARELFVYCGATLATAGCRTIEELHENAVLEMQSHTALMDSQIHDIVPTNIDQRIL